MVEFTDFVWVDLCFLFFMKANFAEGKSKVVRLLKMIWLRKRTKRLEAERKERNHSVWADIRSLNANPHHDKSWRGVEGWMSR